MFVCIHDDGKETEFINTDILNYIEITYFYDDKIGEERWWINFYMNNGDGISMTDNIFKSKDEAIEWLKNNKLI